MSAAELAELRRYATNPGGIHAVEWAELGRLDQQQPPGEWRTWLLLGGRGSGKTRALVEAVLERVRSGKARRLALVAATAADARDVLVEGESGVLNTAPADFLPIYEPSKRRLTWPNGAIATLYSADEPDRLRGPQHDFAACDELAAWNRPEAFDMLLMGLRLPPDPRVIVATTPRPTKIIRDLVGDPSTAISRASTYANLDNLAPSFRERILSRYEGTRLGRQELMAEMLSEVEGALWSTAQLEACQVAKPPQKRRLEDNDWVYEDDLIRVVVGVDPAATSGPDSDETGIVVCAKAVDGRGYVLADRTCRMSPDGWGHRVLAAVLDFKADCVVLETNQGGEMAEAVIRSSAQSMGVPCPRIRKVHASQGKRLRAEPIAALYEQQRISHCLVYGGLGKLEGEMTQFTPDSGFSPDRVDALVHAMTELMVSPARTLRFVA